MWEIPRERLLPIIKKEISARDSIISKHQYKAMGGIQKVAFEISDYHGLKQESVERGLRSLLNDSKREYIRFDTVDKWLTGLGIEHTWHTELDDIYSST